VALNLSQGLKPIFISEAYAALKRRSFTVLPTVRWLSAGMGKSVGGITSASLEMWNSASLIELVLVAEEMET
jgi:hypothetical protein